jgi:hypothetical protein
MINKEKTVPPKNHLNSCCLARKSPEMVGVITQYHQKDGRVLINLSDLSFPGEIKKEQAVSSLLFFVV